MVPSRHQHDKERRNEVQVQDEPSRRDHMLEACHVIQRLVMRDLILWKVYRE